MKLVSRVAIVAAVFALAACGGGGGGSGGGGQDNSNGTTDSSAQRIASALSSGDVAGLQSADGSTLLDRAIAEANSQRSTQSSALASIYGDGTDVTDLSLSIGTNSASIGVQATTTAASYIVADSGAGMAAVTSYGRGRGMAYGADVLQWMAGTTKEQQHYPLFLRAFTWLITGSGSGTLPTTIKYATAGYTASYVKNPPRV